ncbi:MAG: GGDEF domain-containing phosphodiesterase [Gammaproteobacteria bacterium]|nr:GGDEF domain-containing phosphodiesterase [Gammaproteobacteria bacterium]
MDAAIVNQTDSATFLRALEGALRDRTSSSALGLIVASVENLDHLKSVFGHGKALPLMTRLAEKLRAMIGTEDTVIRFGDAKFGIVVRELKNEGHLVLAANKILRGIKNSFDISDASLEAQMRIGATASRECSNDPDTILQQAETALLAARLDNKDFLLYEPGQTSRLKSAYGMEKEIEMALEHGEISMFYQPKVAAANRRPVGAEALMRWSCPSRGFVPPDVFIPVADETGQIESLTWFGIKAALRQCKDWSDRWGPLSVAINVTPSLVERGDLPELLNNLKGLWDVPAEQITIEVTENALMRPDESFAQLSALRETGARVSIDDFGTGYSSLSYFNSIPADELKIDKSFVMKMLDDDGYASIVRTIINLAHDFGLQVTAEGVENRATADALAALDCDYLQGYYFSRPLPQAEFITWLSTYEP